MAQDDEVAKLGQLLDLAQAKGLRLRALVCGSIKLSFDAWPAEGAPAARSADQVRKDRLRDAGRKTFGRDLPDELLEQYAQDGLLS